MHLSLQSSVAPAIRANSARSCMYIWVDYMNTCCTFCFAVALINDHWLAFSQSVNESLHPEWILLPPSIIWIGTTWMLVWRLTGGNHKKSRRLTLYYTNDKVKTQSSRKSQDPCIWDIRRTDKQWIALVLIALNRLSKVVPTFINCRMHVSQIIPLQTGALINLSLAGVTYGIVSNTWSPFRGLFLRCVRKCNIPTC